jgi:hypothetical protein
MVGEAAAITVSIEQVTKATRNTGGCRATKGVEVTAAYLITQMIHHGSSTAEPISQGIEQLMTLSKANGL